VKPLLLCALLLVGCRASGSSGASSTGNSELAELCAADQEEREADWSRLSEAELLAISERDALRRERVLALIQEDALATAEDCYHAALVLQHGDAPEHFLLAHALASIAAFQGYPGANWLAAASLDRFLQNAGRPQVFGTQFTSSQDQPWTMDPFDRSWPDSLRARFGVPPLSESEQRLEELRAEEQPR